MNNNHEKSALNRPGISSRLISEAILNDKQLQQLHAIKSKIYSLATPTVILKYGKVEIVLNDGINHPLLSKINEIIEQRIEQIKQWF